MSAQKEESLSCCWISRPVSPLLIFSYPNFLGTDSIPCSRISLLMENESVLIPITLTHIKTKSYIYKTGQLGSLDGQLLHNHINIVIHFFFLTVIIITTIFQLLDIRLLAHRRKPPMKAAMDEILLCWLDILELAEWLFTPTAYRVSKKVTYFDIG